MKPSLPPSQSHFGTNFLGFVVALATIYLLKDEAIKPFDMMLIVLAASVIPVLCIEHFVFRRYRESTATLTQKRPWDADRVFIKCVGLAGVLLCFGILYKVIPEYNKPMYDAAWAFFMLVIPAMCVAAPFYFAWCDARQDTPEDEYYHLGNLMLLEWKNIDWRAIKRLFRNWLVKAFFLPLMISFSLDSVSSLRNFTPNAGMDFIAWFGPIYAIIMFGDLLYATIGYVFTLKLFNAHIRSSEPTFLGWFAAIMCYAPFWAAVFYPSFFAYDDALDWLNIIPQGTWQYLWGGSILLLMSVYSAATISLGIRFSNLTYRGLVANGPYRFTKHPAYVAKNISWWMISMPFISNEGLGTAIAHSVALLGVNAVYYIRARTEENHLSNYPEYVEYALAMNERSIFAPLAKRVPFLVYKKPENLPKI